MNITPTELYWILKLDALNAVVFFLLAPSIILTLLGCLAIVMSCTEAYTGGMTPERRWTLKIGIWVAALALFFSVVFGVLFALLPTTKEAVIIKGCPELLRLRAVAEVDKSASPTEIVLRVQEVPPTGLKEGGTK